MYWLHHKKLKDRTLSFQLLMPTALIPNYGVTTKRDFLSTRKLVIPWRSTRVSILMIGSCSVHSYALNISGNAKTGTEIVQSSSKAENEVHQQFSLTEDGRICLKKDQSLVLGIKESFFSRREGLRAHLQSADKPGKEQQWSFVVPVIKTTTTQETHEIKKSSNDNNNDEQRGKFMSCMLSCDWYLSFQ